MAGVLSFLPALSLTLSGKEAKRKSSPASFFVVDVLLAVSCKNCKYHTKNKAHQSPENIHTILR